MNINLLEAEKLILKALEIRPNDGYIMDSLGWVYYKQKKYSSAIEKLEKALSLQPEEAVILDHLGDVYIDTGKYDKAMAMYEKAASLYNSKKDLELLEKIKIKIMDLRKRTLSNEKNTKSSEKDIK